MASAAKASEWVGKVRWTICALLFAATTINYLDRQLFSLLIPFFEDELRIGPVDIALINASFLISYGFGMIFVGYLFDKYGTKRGLGIGFLLWNLAAAAHALVGGFMGFVGVRFLLGLGEAANFPASVKTVAEWFPKKERAYATGWFNSGSNIGAILAPILGVLIANQFGWRAAFLVLGIIGLIWLVFWARMYFQPREHPSITPQEIEYIESDHEEETEKISYAELFGMRPVYAIAIGKIFSDPSWWFYITWLPKFLVDQFKLDPKFMTVAIPVVFLIADVGSILGGWLSSRLIQAGKSVGVARKITLLLCALCALPVVLVGQLVGVPTVFGIPTIYVALLLASVAAGAHQGWSCNLFTLVSDTLPRRAVAATVGVITMFGGVGAAIFQIIVGTWVQRTSNYTLPFFLAGTLYLIGLLGMHLLMPNVEPTHPKHRVNLGWVGVGGLGLLALLVVTTYFLNRPPYWSMSDYLTKRAIEIHSPSPGSVGPDAKVGWMHAKWILWRTADGKEKPELLKFDRDNRPMVESKGVKAAKYEGPTIDQVLATTTPPSL